MVTKKIGFLMTALDLIKSNLIKHQRLLLLCSTISELPSDININIKP